MTSNNVDRLYDVSVVIPALNEAGAIQQTVEQARSVVSGCNRINNAQIVVVNDGSTDQTAELAEQAGACVIHHPKPMGYGRALKDGIRAAKYDTIIIFDADGTYPIEKIPEFVEIYDQGYELVIGARTGAHYRQSFFKLMLRIFLKFLVEFATGKKIADINSGMRIFSRATVLGYFGHLCETFSFSTSQTLAYLLTNRIVLHHPIPYSERSGETKVRLFRDSLRTLQFILFQVLYFNPFKIFLLLAISMLLTMCVSFAVVLLIKLTVLYVLGIGCFFFAILFFSMGLISEQLRQIWGVNNEKFRS